MFTERSDGTYLYSRKDLFTKYLLKHARRSFTIKECLYCETARVLLRGGYFRPVCFVYPPPKGGCDVCETESRLLCFLKRPVIAEFLRYLPVGTSSFAVDFGTLVLLKQLILPDWNGCGLYIATALGFIAGLVYNYILSLLFVFKAARGKSRSAGAFIVFAVIGVVGMALTELGMHVGVDALKIHYMIVKIFVAAAVFFWNYTARKLLVFRRK